MQIMIVSVLCLFVSINIHASEAPANTCKDDEKAFFIREYRDRNNVVQPAHYKCLRFDREAIQTSFSKHVEALKLKVHAAESAARTNAE
jgi:hypothetical protein